MNTFNAKRDHYEISTDKTRLDIGTIEELLRDSYWAASRSREDIVRTIEHSLCFGLYDIELGSQIGFSRVVSDYTTFAWLCDVIMDPGYRGKGLGKWLVSETLSHPELQGLQRFILATRDAHALYTIFGFEPLQEPSKWMLKQ